MRTTIAISPELTDDERRALAAAGRDLLSQHNVVPIDRRGGDMISVSPDVTLTELAEALEARGFRLGRDPHRRWGLRVERIA